MIHLLKPDDKWIQAFDSLKDLEEKTEKLREVIITSNKRLEINLDKITDYIDSLQRKFKKQVEKQTQDAVDKVQKEVDNRITSNEENVEDKLNRLEKVIENISEDIQNIKNEQIVHENVPEELLKSPEDIPSKDLSEKEPDSKPSKSRKQKSEKELDSDTKSAEQLVESPVSEIDKLSRDNVKESDKDDEIKKTDNTSNNIATDIENQNKNYIKKLDIRLKDVESDVKKLKKSKPKDAVRTYSTDPKKKENKLLSFFNFKKKEASNKPIEQDEKKPAEKAIEQKIDAEKVKITDDQLKDLNLRYNEKAQRYQETEKNEKGRKNFVAYDEVVKRLEKKQQPNAEKINITDDQLKDLNLRYNEKAQRYQETENNEKGRKDFVAYDEVVRRLKEKEDKQNPEEKPQPKKSLFNKITSPVKNLFNGIKNFFSKKKEGKEDKSVSILEAINNNLIQANESLKNVLKFLTGEEPSGGGEEDGGGTGGKGGDDKDAEKEKKDKKKDSGLMKAFGFTLFAFAPFLIAKGRELVDTYREKIVDFIEPIFNFIFQTVPKFFTETVPNFFTKTVPDYFKEKFDVIKGRLEDFMDNITIFQSSIKKGVGNAIVAIGDAIPFGLGKSIKDFGQKMVNEADKDISAAEESKNKRQEERNKKESVQLLKDQAEEYAKKFVENSNGKYTSYDIKYNDQTVVVSYTGPNTIKGGLDQVFDTQKSLETGTLLKLEGPEEKADGTPVSTETPSTPPTSVDAKPEDKPEGEASQSASGAPDAVPATSGGSTAPSGGDSAGSGAASSGGVATPSPAGSAPAAEGATGGTTTQTPAATPEPAPAASASGDQITKGSLEATAPVQTQNKSATTNVIPIGGRQSGSFAAIPGKPQDIHDVPDPTPILGSLAEQLFYLRA